MKSIYIGLISGTSTDAIDAVAVKFDQASKATQLGAIAFPLENDLREQIFFIQNNKISLSELGELNSRIGEAFANAALHLIKSHNVNFNEIAAIGSHGQTVKHNPDALYPYTLQLGNPSIIAERTNLTTVADFRSRDIAAGGQGAPLVLAFHQAWLGQIRNAVVLNLGGIANITVLNEAGMDPKLGFDTGPANTLLDAWTRKHLQQNFDMAGQWARSGKTNQALLNNLLSHPYFNTLPPKSADIEAFNLEWLESTLPSTSDLTPQDIASTLVELTVNSIANAIKKWAPETEQIIACGGGCKNIYLVEELTKRVEPISYLTSSEFGIDVDWVEATAFAWLAHQTLHNKPGNAHHSTGAIGPRILGAVYFS